MKPAAVRLLIFVTLFAGWLTYLAYLASTSPHPQMGETRGESDGQLWYNPAVLSRPQFLVSNLDVIAQLDRIDPPPAEVTIDEVHWPSSEQKIAHQSIKITNLAKCEGWSGPGKYILPLMKFGKDEYRVAPQPRSPRFRNEPLPRIYLDTPETRHQLDAVPKPVAR